MGRIHAKLYLPGILTGCAMVALSLPSAMAQGGGLPDVGAIDVGAVPVNDLAQVNAGEETGIDVLRNDHGVTDQVQGSLRVTDAPECLHARASGGRILVNPGSGCLGEQIFFYSFTDQGSARSAQVTVTVNPPAEHAEPPQAHNEPPSPAPEQQHPAPSVPEPDICSAPQEARMPGLMQVAGGSFQLGKPPEGMRSFARKLRSAGVPDAFSVSNFCFMKEEAPASLLALIRRADGDRRRVGNDAHDMPEAYLPPEKLSTGELPAMGVRYSEAEALARELSKNGQTWRLPTIEQYAAALWRIFENDEEAAYGLLHTYYAGVVEWTSTRCGPQSAQGFFALGMDRNYKFRIFCFPQEHMEKQMGFRLVRVK